MPHRKLVRIGETPTLPTISQFLKDMAVRQHEEIQRLKSEALSGELPDPTVPEADHDSLTPDPWQLHPVRVKRIPKKRATSKKSLKLSRASSRAKSAETKKKSTKASARPRAAKKVVKKKAIPRKKK
jgi:hypothetical protein